MTDIALQPVVLIDIRHRIDDPFPSGLADENCQTERATKQVVTQSAAVAHTIKVLKGRRCAKLPRQHQTLGKTILADETVREGTGILLCIRVVDDADTRKRYQSPSAQSVLVIPVAVEQVIHQVNMKVLVSP